MIQECFTQMPDAAAVPGKLLWAETLHGMSSSGPLLWSNTLKAQAPLGHQVCAHPSGLVRPVPLCRDSALQGPQGHLP